MFYGPKFLIRFTRAKSGSAAGALEFPMHDGTCLQTGIAFKNPVLGMVPTQFADTAEDCQKKCADSTVCTWFTWRLGMTRSGLQLGELNLKVC